MLTMEILQLAPLVRRFREQIEAKEVPFEDSMKTLSYASELVLFKVRWLLPNAEVEDARDEVVEEESSLEAATLSPVMDSMDVGRATALLAEAMRGAAAAFPRGFAASLRDERRVVVTSIEPRELRKAFLAAEMRTARHGRGVILPRWSFVTHLRKFWHEVRRLASRGGVLTFSRFLGQSKMDAILNFLAFLELVKRRRLYARQRSLFGEIVFSTDKERISQEEARP